ncbi:MAG: isomerase [Micavibrio sp.]|nr:isomerase [Micavibrio sp.]
MAHEIKIWQVDSFAKEAFKGNPAAVCVLREELSDALMQNIAIENNLSETAFILMRDGKAPLLRWFTPMFEIDLCGHATLAAAHIYLSELEQSADEVEFDTKFVGPLKVVKKAGSNTDNYVMNFPSRAGDEVGVEEIPAFVLDALSTKKPVEARQSRDLMLVYECEDDIRAIDPDFQTLAQYKDFIIVTAPSDDPQYDFVSRFFCADDGIAEDPVTGSAHCTLAPYWAQRSGKKKMLAHQISKRGGVLDIEIIDGDRVLIGGDAVTVLEGIFKI